MGVYASFLYILYYIILVVINPPRLFGVADVSGGGRARGSIRPFQKRQILPPHRLHLKLLDFRDTNLFAPPIPTLVIFWCEPAIV